MREHLAKLHRLRATVLDAQADRLGGSTESLFMTVAWKSYGSISSAQANARTIACSLARAENVSATVLGIVVLFALLAVVLWWFPSLPEGKRTERQDGVGSTSLPEGNSVDSLSRAVEAWSRKRAEVVEPPFANWEMANEGKRAYRKAKQKHPMPQRIDESHGRHWVTAKYWGIGRQQIEDLVKECRGTGKWDDDFNVHQFVQEFVKPQTQGKGMGYALMINQDKPLAVNLMVSHAWLENARLFFQDVLTFMQPHEVAYICFLSNYQGSKSEIDEQLGNVVDKLPFTQALKNAERMLVVPCQELAKKDLGLYSRLWCIWEVKVAVDLGIPISIMPGRRDSMYLNGGRKGSIAKHAECGDKEDTDLIREGIEQMPPLTLDFRGTTFLITAVCVAWGPSLVRMTCAWYKLKEDTFYWDECVGWALGLMVGIFIRKVIAKPIFNWMLAQGERNNFDVIDEVILAAAEDKYSYKRIDPAIDLPNVLLLFLGFLGPAILLKGYCHDWAWEQVFHVLVITDEILMPSLALAIMTYVLWDVNKLGSWTGCYIADQHERRMTTSQLLILLVAFRTMGGFLEMMFPYERKGSMTVLGLVVGILLMAKCREHQAVALMTIPLVIITVYLRRFNWKGIFFLAISYNQWVLMPTLPAKYKVLSFFIYLPCQACLIYYDHNSWPGVAGNDFCDSRYECRGDDCVHPAETSNVGQ